ncbi:MAG TPA: response regulator [Acidobacteriota bacterium]|nr:response regulator [Acidobacteriota bacterium]
MLAASTPREAINLAQTHTGEIHLPITDLVLPEMNGRELMERLCATRSRLKCVHMSGHSSDVIPHQADLGENVRLIKKPFKGEELAAAVRAVLDEA